MSLTEGRARERTTHTTPRKGQIIFSCGVGLLGAMDRNFNPIGMCYTWGGEEPCGFRRADRRHHLYVLGKTGTGKTTFLRNLILQDIIEGQGIGLLDPHGDLADELLDHIPSSRTDDVVYFNPADTEFPIGFNLFFNVPLERRPLVASGFVGACK